MEYVKVKYNCLLLNLLRRGSVMRDREIPYLHKKNQPSASLTCEGKVSYLYTSNAAVINIEFTR